MLKYLKPLHDKSIKSNLLAISNFCQQRAAEDKVAARKEAFEKVAVECAKLAHGRYVTRLLDYLE